MKLTILGLLLAASHLPYSLGFEVPAVIKEIDRYAENLDRRVPQMVKLEKEVLTGTDGGGKSCLFLLDNSVQKSELKIGLSNRQLDSTFYYRDKHLVLIVNRESFFRFDPKNGTIDPRQFGGMVEERYYFDGDRLQYQISFNDSVACTRDRQVSERAQHLNRLSQVILLSAGSKDAVIDLERLLKAGSQP